MDFMDRVKAFFSAVWSFLMPAAMAIVHNGGPVLIQAAEDAVTAAESTGGTGAEKFAAATAAVIADLTVKGLPIVTNAINIAIESAVAKLKATVKGVPDDTVSDGSATVQAAS